MITLHTDISYTNLYHQLLRILQGSTNPVFSEAWIVVPNQSAKTWLQKSLARDLGVCAQIKFIMPLAFHWEIIKNVSNSKHDVNVFHQDVLRWQIYQWLENDPQYSVLKQDSAIKNFAMAEKIAQTLLQYNEDFPEKIAQWQKNTQHVAAAQQWQVDMWLQLKEHLPTLSPAELLQQFDAQKHFDIMPNNIIMFAVEQLSQLQMATLVKLAEKQPIHLFLSNPCPDDYWFDLSSEAKKARHQLFNSELAEILEIGNPLLSSLGYGKMALFDSLLQQDIKMMDNDRQNCGTSLLDSVKHDIFTLSQHPSPWDCDNSISIHSCHNRKRELEVIKDEILHHLEQDTQLNPEDILVVAPDINDYVQGIREVFHPNNGHYLPHQIDRVQLADDAYVAAFMQLLHSFEGEMSATVIYQLLTDQVIMDKFGIDENDLPRVKNWILSANIRNFYSRQHKTDLGLQATIGNTWEFGKNRWLAGYLADDVQDVDYLSCFGDIVGQEPLFSACFDFLDAWYLYYLKFHQSASPQDWYRNISQLSQDFLFTNSFDTASTEAESKILNQLENTLLNQSLECTAKIPLVVVNNIIEKHLSESHFASEGQIGIKFQSWANAFIAPAKLVIVLGLNDGEFPSNQAKNDLDIFANNPARLNKSTRTKDKNLVLSVLTEQAKCLIFTYIGFDASSNEAQPPSVILAELSSYLARKTDNKFEPKQHKMHGYDKHYFDITPASFNTAHHHLAESFYAPKKPQQPAQIGFNQEPQTEIDLTDFIQYFTDPLDFFLKHRAQIKQAINEDLLQDTETYQPNGLEGWQLRQEIFTHGIASAGKTGIISDHNSAQHTLNAYQQELLALVQMNEKLQCRSTPIHRQIQHLSISGQVEIDKNQTLVSIIANNCKAKSLCQHWIKHLCYPNQQPSYVYFIDKIIQFKPVKDPQVVLMAILDKWQQSFNQPWLFCPSAAIKLKVESAELASTQEYLKQFEDDQYHFPSEGQKYFIQQIQTLGQQELEKNQQQFIQPLIDAMEFITWQDTTIA